MLYTDHRSQQKFLELGFIIDPTASRDVAFRQIYDSLVIYKSIYKDLLVPRGFVVPKMIEWPEELHGLRLGIRVGSIRAGESYFNLQYAGTLDSLGFIYDVNEYKFELFLEALKIYKKKCGNMYIPQSFSVEEDDETWPERLRGYKLGHKVKDIRQSAAGLNRNMKASLDSIGFAWQVKTSDFDGGVDTDLYPKNSTILCI